MSEATYYQVLQVDPGASKEVIEAAYRRLAKMYHPDVNQSPDAARKMQAINEAYEVLRDPVARFQYNGTLKWRDPQPTYAAPPKKPQSASTVQRRTSKAGLAYQRRVRGGYVIKIGRADDFDEVLETLKFRVPSSARRYDPDKKDWFVAEDYANVLEDLFYDFRPNNTSGIFGATGADTHTSTAAYQNRQSTSSSDTWKTKGTPKEKSNTGCLIVAIVAIVLLWWNWPTGNAPAPSTAEQNSSNEDNSEPRLGIIEAQPKPTLDCPHVVESAVAQAEPRLSASVVYTVPVNECLEIHPIGREVSGVPWYELADGTWLRATLVEDQPHWEFEPPTPEIIQEPEPVEQLATTTQRANVRNGPCLAHPILRTLTQGSQVSIVGYSDEGSHVWYALRDDGWIREDLVRDAPTVPEVEAPACPTLDVEASTEQNCRGGCTTYPAFCAPPIKGNVSFNTGEKIYHVPGQQYYDATVIDPRYGERWFCTEEEARDAGWRKTYR